MLVKVAGEIFVESTKILSITEDATNNAVIQFYDAPGYVSGTVTVDGKSAEQVYKILKQAGAV